MQHEWHAGTRYKQHPIEHYMRTKRKSVSWPKAMVDPDYTFGHHVHNALDLPGHGATVMDKQCMRVLHLQNLFSKRFSAEHFYNQMSEDISSFHWVLDNLTMFSDVARRSW
jgi:hypothetical protein